MQFELNAQTRAQQGSGASRRLRRASRVPAILYGGSGEPKVIELDHNELLLVLRKEAFRSSLISLKLDGTAETVLLRDLQMHAYKPQVMHVDFQRVDAGRMLRQRIPLHFINGELSPGVKENGGAKLVGQTTYGKGLIQKLERFDAGDGARITIMQYVTPDGAPVNGIGITPDIEVVQPEGAEIGTATDAQLQRAIGVLEG
jgi:ribosomal protein bL25 (Ctc-form)